MPGLSDQHAIFNANADPFLRQHEERLNHENDAGLKRLMTVVGLVGVGVVDAQADWMPAVAIAILRQIVTLKDRVSCLMRRPDRRARLHRGDGGVLSFEDDGVKLALARR